MTEDKSADTDSPVPADHLAGLTGMDLVRRTLEEARGAARSQGKNVGRGRGSPHPAASPAAGGRGRGRDPTTVTRRRWARRLETSPGPADGRRGSPRAPCSGSGTTVVGEQIAAHATPTACVKGC